MRVGVIMVYGFNWVASNHAPNRLAALIYLIQDYECTYDAWHPTAEREQKDDEHRTTTLVDDRQGWKEDCEQHT